MTKYLMFCRASLSGDRETAWKIFNEWNNAVIRRIGMTVKGFDENIWNGQRSMSCGGTCSTRSVSEISGVVAGCVNCCAATGDATGVEGVMSVSRLATLPAWRG